MAAHRYWRLTGFCVDANGPLELSEVRLYAGGVLADATAALTATLPPTGGTLSDLKDGLATGAVSWAYDVHRQAGFALVWDFGVGGDIALSNLRLGSGASAGTYPRDITAQWSATGLDWTTERNVQAANYPGAFTLTIEPAAESGDPDIDKVSLLLRGDGTNGSTTFADDSPSPKTVTPFGIAQISTAQSKFGGSSMFFDGRDDNVAGREDYLECTHSTDFAFGTGDFTMEAWVYLLSSADETAISVGHPDLTTNPGWSLQVIGGLIYVGGDAGTLGVSTGAWHHLAAARQGTTMRAFVDGVQGLSVANSTNGASTGVFIGKRHTSAGSTTGNSYGYLSGYIDEVRVTKGLARYTANFTPPTVAFPGPGGVFLPLDNPAPKRWRSVPTNSTLFVGSALPAVGYASSVPRVLSFMDAYHGGRGIVYGTVKEKNAPANTPWRRKVLLIDEASHITIRETWSDAVTGNYEFRGVKEGVKYTVLSYDHTGAHRAVVADAQVPELMV